MHVWADVNLVIILLIMLVESISFLRKAITNSSSLITPSLSVSISSITLSENWIWTDLSNSIIDIHIHVLVNDYILSRYYYWVLTFCGVGSSIRCFSGTRWKRCDIMASNSSLDMLPFLSESKILRKGKFIEMKSIAIFTALCCAHLNICWSFVFAVPSFIIVIIRRNSLNSMYPFPFESYRLNISASSSS